MSAVTLTMPSGAKFRTGTVRRLVLVVEYPGEKPKILKRSDSIGTLLVENRRRRNKGNRPGVIIDTDTGEVC